MFNSIKKARGHEEGFTLIELLVVIVILGILAAVVVFAVSGIGDKGQGNACKIDTRTLRTAEEAYWGRPGGGSYGTEAQLKSGGFIQDESSLHDISLGDTPVGTTYSVTNVAPCTDAA